MAHYDTGRKFGAFILLTGVMSGTAWAGSPAAPAYAPGLLPANPQTGECYARIEIPAQHSVKSETVLIREGYTSYDVSQPQISTRQQEIMVKEPSVRYEVRQPTYKTVTEQIMVRPAYDKLVVRQPSFKTEVETVRVSEPRLVWKRGNPTRLRAQGYKIHSTADPNYNRHTTTRRQGTLSGPEPELCGPTCEIWCLVEDPGESVSYNRKVLASRARVDRVPVSARYQSVTKQVVADPGGVREVPVQGEYRTITVEEVNPGVGTREVNVPAEYGTIGRKVMTSPSRYEWRRVVCLPGTGNNRASTNRTSTHTVTSGTIPHHSSGYRHSYTTSSHGTRSVTGSTSHSPETGTTYQKSHHSTGKREKPRYRKH